MGNPAEEKVIFEAFLQSAPLFAGAAVKKWCPAKEEPSDIDCDLVDGRRLGIQLTTWLDQQQMERSKGEEALGLPFLEALGPLPPNELDNIHLVWTFPRRTFRKSDTQSFRIQVLQLITELDKRWEREPDWQSPQSFQWTDFGRYPILARYISAFEVHPRMVSVPSTMEKGKLGWLTIEPRGYCYVQEEMVDALYQCVRKKLDKYPAKPAGKDEFHLLVHYDKAWEYNSPVTGIDFEYADAVRLAANRIKGAGVFDKIFVYVGIAAERREVFRLYPA